MDPALISPLTDITDYLLRCKPGVISIPNIIKISQYYGFETFNENNRLTIAGKIILIDIDYDIEGEELIQKISISLAIDLQNDDRFNFMKLFDSLLYNNLKESTLSKFNDNFKKLCVLDKFSSLKFDLFNYLNNEINKLISSNGDLDLKLNLHDDLGFFIKIHQNYKYLNDKLNTPQRDNFYLEINIKETKDTMINDLKCGICLELVSESLEKGLIIPELVLIKLGINNYNFIERVNIASKLQHYKVISLIGSPLVNLKQFFLSDLSKLRPIIPVLQNWYLINNVILKDLVESYTVSDNTQQSLDEEATDLNIDDFLGTTTTTPNVNLIELILVENRHLQININSTTTLNFNNGHITSENELLAQKVSKIEDLYRVLESPSPSLI